MTGRSTARRCWRASTPTRSSTSGSPITTTAAAPQAKTLPRGEFPERRQRRRRLRHGQSQHGRRRPPVDRSHPAGRLRRLPGRSRSPLLRRPAAISGNGPLPRLDARHRWLGLGRLPADPIGGGDRRVAGPRLLGAGGARAGVLPAPCRCGERCRIRAGQHDPDVQPGRSCRGAGLRRARHRRAARDGRDRRPARQGVRSRSVRDVGPPRGPDPRRRRLLLAQGRGPRSGARARLCRDLHAKAVQPLGRVQPPRPPQPLGRGRRAGPDRLRPRTTSRSPRWGAGSSAASWSMSTR